MLERHLDDLLEPIYYLAGPPSMTEAMREMLKACGLGEESMRCEDIHSATENRTAARLWRGETLCRD
jgi:NAD(P)H-flavin reductase